MSLQQGEGPKHAVQVALQEAGIPRVIAAKSDSLIGQAYRFLCEHGSHHHILMGSIFAIEVSDEGPLKLYVTSPKMWGERVECLAWIKTQENEMSWAVCLAFDKAKMIKTCPKGVDINTHIYNQTVFPGTLELLS